MKDNRYRIQEVNFIGEEISTANTDSVLAALFQRVMFELGINDQKFHLLLEKYLTNPRNGIPQNITDKSSARGNLRKELLRRVMSWKVFIKGLKFLNIRKCKLSITLTHVNGSETIHAIDINLNTMELEEVPPPPKDVIVKPVDAPTQRPNTILPNFDANPSLTLPVVKNKPPLSAYQAAELLAKHSKKD